ncbi:hypothetical protein BTN31_11070 [Corynebacterium striatum]|nr:hypothetical protein [Corynebacterium striatum]
MLLQNPVGPSPESEYIDADQLAAEWNPDEFPLVDLNDPVSLEGIPETVLLQLQQEQANRDSSTPWKTSDTSNRSRLGGRTHLGPNYRNYFHHNKPPSLL